MAGGVIREGAPVRRDPFLNSADPSLYVARPAAEEALDAMQSAIDGEDDRHPFLVAPPGYGKTLMLHVLACRLAASWAPVYLPYPMLTADELCRWALLSLGIDDEPDPEGALLAEASSDRSVRGLILLIDEADSLPAETTRQLFEFADASEGRLRFAFAAVPCEASSRLSAHSAVESVNYTAPLAASECVAYVDAKLRRLDATRRDVFSADRVHAIWAESDGCPGAVDFAASDLLLRGATPKEAPPSEPRLAARAPKRTAPQRKTPPRRPSATRPPWAPPPGLATAATDRNFWRFGLGAASGTLIAIGLVGLADPFFFQRMATPTASPAPSETEIASLVHETDLAPPSVSFRPTPAPAARGAAAEPDGQALEQPAITEDLRVAEAPVEEPSATLPPVSSPPPPGLEDSQQRQRADAEDGIEAPAAIAPVSEPDRSVRETPPARVSVEAPDGTLVEVAGRLFGPAPFSGPLPIPPGSQRFIARLPDGSVMMRRQEARDGARVVFYSSR